MHAALDRGGALHKSSTVDPFGNATLQTDDGVRYVDDSITTATTPSLVKISGRSGDPSGWMYRTVESFVTSIQDPTVRKHTFTQYNLGGDPAAGAVGPVRDGGARPIPRGPGRGHRPRPDRPQSSDGTIVVSTKVYDNFGQLTQQTATNGRCRQMGYDGPFDELATSEGVFVGLPYHAGQPPPPPCAGTAFRPSCSSTTARSDFRSRCVDIHGELTTASYDGFARLTALTKPDPQQRRPAVRRGRR